MPRRRDATPDSEAGRSGAGSVSKVLTPMHTMHNSAAGHDSLKPGEGPNKTPSGNRSLKKRSHSFLELSLLIYVIGKSLCAQTVRKKASFPHRLQGKSTHQTSTHNVHMCGCTRGQANWSGVPASSGWWLPMSPLNCCLPEILWLPDIVGVTSVPLCASAFIFVKQG